MILALTFIVECDRSRASTRWQNISEPFARDSALANAGDIAASARCQCRSHDPEGNRNAEDNYKHPGEDKEDNLGLIQLHGCLLGNGKLVNEFKIQRKLER